jgi:hypothetical protein
MSDLGGLLSLFVVTVNTYQNRALILGCNHLVKMFDDTAARNKNEQIEITSLFMYFNLKGSEKLRNRQNLDAQF